MTEEEIRKEAAKMLGKKGGGATLAKYGKDYFKSLRKKSSGRKKSESYPHIDKRS